MKWGLVRHWTTDIGPAKRSINAQAETIAEKAVFRGRLEHNRCLVPASGFFEWKKVGAGRPRSTSPCRMNRSLPLRGSMTNGMILQETTVFTYTILT